MKQRYCEIPQDVLLRLLRFPEGTQIVRMDVVHDSPVVGSAPLRIVVESDEFYDTHHGTSMCSISPWYSDCPTPEFKQWWSGATPPCGHFSHTDEFAKECT